MKKEMFKKVYLLELTDTGRKIKYIYSTEYPSTMDDQEILNIMYMSTPSRWLPTHPDYKELWHLSKEYPYLPDGVFCVDEEYRIVKSWYNKLWDKIRGQ